MEHSSFTLYPRPPFRLDLTAWCLRRREENRIDLWDGRTYLRVFLLGGVPCLVAVTEVGSAERPQLHVDAVGTPIPDTEESTLRQALAMMLGIEDDLAPLYRLAREDSVVGPLIERFRGMRPPRFPTLFETLLNGFACQQVSLAACIHLLNRLAEVRGRDVSHLHPGICILPEPGDLAGLDPEALREIGFSQQKSRYTIGLARQIEDDRLDLSLLASMSDDEARESLQQISGIGRWTADYVLLRGLGRWHIFPAGDAGARSKLRHWLAPEVSRSDEALQQLIDSWQPFGGLVYFHLLLRDLELRGYLRGGVPHAVRR